MKSFREFIFLHWWAVLAAFLVGVMFSLPQVLSRIAIGDAYQGAPFFSQNDDETYLTNIQEIIDGHWTASSPIFDGYKDSKSYILPIGEYLYALPAILLGIPILSVVAISKFVFPAALFLLVYVLIYSLAKGADETSRQLNSIAGGLLVLLGYDFADLGYILALLSGKAEPVYSVMWARLVNPITGGLFLMSHLILVWYSLKEKKGLTRSIIAGLILFLSAGYFFSYATGLAITAVLITVMFLKREFIYVRNLAITIFVGLIPLFIQLSSVLRSGALGGQSSSLSKLGLLYTHHPVINTLLVIASTAFACLLVFLYKKDGDKEQDGKLWWWFCLSILLGFLVAYNQQLVTGMAIWPQHFVQYSIPLIYVVVMAAFYKIVLPWSKKLWLLGIAIIFTTTIFWGVWVVSLYPSRLDEYANSQRYTPAFEWFNTEAPNPCVIFAIEDSYLLSNKVTAYTHCDVYYSMNTLYGLPQDRIEHGYLSWLSFRGIRAENIEEYLKENKEEVYTTSFTNWMEKFRASDYSWLREIQDEDKLEEWEVNSTTHLAKVYRDFQKIALETQLKKYRINYVLWDKTIYPDWNPASFTFLEGVFETDKIFIFKVR